MASSPCTHEPWLACSGCLSLVVAVMEAAPADSLKPFVTHSCPAHSRTCSLTNSLTHLHAHSRPESLAHSPSHSTYSLTNTFACSHTQSTHSLLIHWIACSPNISLTLILLLTSGSSIRLMRSFTLGDTSGQGSLDRSNWPLSTCAQMPASDTGREAAGGGEGRGTNEVKR